MAELLILALIQQEDADASRRIPRNRIPIRRCNAFQASDENFISNFRLSKRLAYRLIEELRPFLEPKTNRRDVLSTEVKVLCALNFFAFGSHQKKIAKNFPNLVSQASVSKCIRVVAEAMSKNLLTKYVYFPKDKRAQDAIKKDFLEYCGLEGVLGVIDCTHVAILAPSDDGFHNERNYYNMKGWSSLNAQFVCDTNMRILNVCARFPGCVSDSYIWECSLLKRSFDTKRMIHGDGWLLGDVAYPQETHLHIPISTASPGSPAEKYNAAHATGRSVIERCNGMLKNRFQCLLKQRTLRYIPEVAGGIINSCMILHNMCVEGEMRWDDIDLSEEDELFNTFEH